MNHETTNIDSASQRFAELAAGGVAIPSGLEAAAAECGDRGMARGLENLASRLRRGSSPEDASFSDIERLVASLVSSEKGNAGFTDALMEITSWQDHSLRLRRSIGTTLIYPVFLVVLALSLAVITGQQVVPGITNLLDSFDLDLEPSMRGLIWWHQHAWGALLFLTLFVIAVMTLLAYCGPMWLWEWITRRVPLLGTGLSHVDASDMCHHVGNLLERGNSYPDAFRIAQAGIKSPRLKRWLSVASQSIQRGRPLRSSIHELPRDTLVLGTLVDTESTGEMHPGRSWLLAARYFRTIGQKRVVLAKTMIPVAGYLTAFFIGIAVVFGMLAPLTVVLKLVSGLGGWL